MERTILLSSACHWQHPLVVLCLEGSLSWTKSKISPTHYLGCKRHGQKWTLTANHVVLSHLRFSEAQKQWLAPTITNYILISLFFSTLNSKQRVKLSLSRMFASYHFNFTQISLQIKRSNYERLECQRRLPVRQRTEHKMLTFRSLGGSVTRYLSDLIELWRPTWALRSSTSLDLVVPPTRLKVHADRTF